MGHTVWAYDVRVADTLRERYQGLSKTDALPEDHGLLFVYDQEAAARTFVIQILHYYILCLLKGK